MFAELKSLLARRSLTITVAAVAGDRIRVNVVPHSLPEDTKANEQIKYSHKDEVAPIPEASIKALTTPVSLTGTAEEIDAKLSAILLNYAESHTQLQATVDQATTEITGAVKAIEERNKNKAKAKTGSGSKKDEKAESAKPEEKRDDTLPLWWTNSSVPAPGTTSPQSTPAAASEAVAPSTPSAQEVPQECQ